MPAVRSAPIALLRPEMDLFYGTLPAIAIALLVGLWVAGRAQGVGFPRVTAYLLTGMVLGPHVIGRFLSGPAAHLALDAEAVEVLGFVKQVALGFILFRVGTEFRFTELRRSGPRILAISALEMGATVIAIFLAVWALTGDLVLASLAPILGTASAPSATLLTLREVEAEGRSSRTLIQLVGLDNLATLLAFPVLLALLYGAGTPGIATGQALVALVGGGTIGLVAAVLIESWTGPKERVTLGLFLVFGCLGLAQLLNDDPTGPAMLACFGAGLTLANASPHSDAMCGLLESAVYPLYVLFFIVAGAELHLESLLHLGLLGIAFIVARTLGKWLGVRLGLWLTRWGETMPMNLGSGLLCQAGVALGLIEALENFDIEGTEGLREVALASVVFFELVGPYLTRRCAVKAGEVKLANVMKHHEQTAVIREVTGELARNLGVSRWRGDASDHGLSVRHVMLRAQDKALANTPFEEVLKLVSEIGSDLLPVTDDHGTLLGVISFNDIKDIIYDPHLRNLVIAEDLMKPLEDPVGPEFPLRRALELMDARHVHSIPVVEKGRLIGMIKRKDAYSTLHRALRTARTEQEKKK